MRRITKVILFVLVFLLIKSIFHDLSVGTAMKLRVQEKTPQEEISPTDDTIKEEEIQDNQDEQNTNEKFKIVTYKVQAGDTVLSIAEKLNEGSIPIQELLDDFQALNPNVNPHQITINETYSFPVYNNIR